MKILLDRKIEPELKRLAKKYPVVTITGPRQAGKTTLVKKVYPKKAYVNMALSDNQLFAHEDPRGFFAQYPDGCILDEVQKVPELLGYIQDIVDTKQQNGMFILTGSNQLALSNAVSQSLAGRTALLYLLPLSIQELMAKQNDLDINTLLYNGFLPRVHTESQDPTKAYRNYLQTYIERDVRELIHLKSLANFQKFLVLCAGRIGQLINYDNLATEVGVSNGTIKEWLSVLEASYIILRLPPYFNNLGKRVIKTPKLYFSEIGLATYLLGIQNIEQLKRDPLRGQLVENLVVLELMKARYNKGLDPNLYFYRDQHQNEVDVVYARGHELIPIEIKFAMTVTSQLLRPIKYFSQLVLERCPASYLIYTGENEMRSGHLKILNFKNTHEVFELEDTQGHPMNL